jgi:hypothetical protein
VYEEAKRVKDEADDAVIFAYQKKKSQVSPSLPPFMIDRLPHTHQDTHRHINTRAHTQHSLSLSHTHTHTSQRNHHNPQAAERKQVKEQKEEAERYAAKSTELAELTTEGYLFQVCFVCFCVWVIYICVGVCRHNNIILLYGKYGKKGCDGVSIYPYICMCVGGWVVRMQGPLSPFPQHSTLSPQHHNGCST